MASRTVAFEQDGPDDVVRVDGLIVGRLTGQDANRQMQWREGQSLDESRVDAFEKAFGASDRSREAAETALRTAGLA